MTLRTSRHCFGGCEGVRLNGLAIGGLHRIHVRGGRTVAAFAANAAVLAGSQCIWLSVARQAFFLKSWTEHSAERVFKAGRLLSQEAWRKHQRAMRRICVAS